jgi:hypothetical protein
MAILKKPLCFSDKKRRQRFVELFLHGFYKGYGGR